MSERSDAKGLIQLGSHVAAILAAGVLVWTVSDFWWLMIPAQMVLGILITFLFCPHHETVPLDGVRQHLKGNRAITHPTT